MAACVLIAMCFIGADSRVHLINRRGAARLADKPKSRSARSVEQDHDHHDETDRALLHGMISYFNRILHIPIYIHKYIMVLKRRNSSTN